VLGVDVRVYVGLGVLVGVFEGVTVAVCVGDATAGLQAVIKMTASRK
jgi:hypothetical protein